jgi:tRNA-2-methylthio-N6-dimethylallyladenosine synthase
MLASGGPFPIACVAASCRPTTLAKKLYVKTYGCQMNVYDSARMADVLAPLGYGPADSVEDADMIILNTCHIREKAAEKVFSELGRLRPLKLSRAAEGGRLILAVAGCVAQAEGEEILRRAPYVDIVLGPQTYHRLPEMVAQASRAGGAVLDTEFPVEPKFDFLPDARAASSREAGSAAFLSVQEGCDKFCTFCVVPYTRGGEYSRPAAAVVAEARRLVADGAVEITLLGQNVNGYHGEAASGPEWGLGRLIRELAGINGLSRIRYTTSHPRDMADDLITAHAEVPQLMPFLHLPVQSGSDRVLEAMNRRHDRAFYLQLAERLKTAQPDLALSSDFIVGFPGETDEDFRDSLDLIRRVGFVQTYSFKYSSRPGTPAAAIERQVPEAIKEERLAEIQALLLEQTAAFNHATVGRVLSVLLDRPGRHPGQLVGRSPYMQPVHVSHVADRLGQVVPVRIVAVGPNSLAGEVAEEEKV